MSIFPLPVFEADSDPHHRDSLTDEEIYERLKPPTSIVVRFGAMKLVGEYPYDGDAKPGCGSKLVIRTHRGTEIGEMLTSTCPNAGCSKSVSRNEMLEYIENSGGKDYPFHTEGRILRVATIEDINAQSALANEKPQYTRVCKQLIAEFGLDMKLVDVEPILGGELLTFYYMSEHRVDFRELVKRLASEFKTRIEMRQIGARDEARLVADYERCGQYCCCKNFLKVLKPVSMRSAKVQKATLDPLKISGRCGRLMCCLRYEDETYEELRKRLPKKKKHVGTQFGPGIVVDTKILVQLALVRLEHNGEEVAIPVEELMYPESCPKPDEFGFVRAAAELEKLEQQDDPLRGLTTKEVEEHTDEKKRKRRSRRRKDKGKSKSEQQDAYRDKSQRLDGEGGIVKTAPGEKGDGPTEPGEKPSRRRKKRRRKRRGNGKPAPTSGSQKATDDRQPSGSDGPRKKRKKRSRRGRRKRGRRGGGSDSDSGGGGEDA